MHEQIRTSPGSTGDNFRRVVEVLADAGVNIAGIAPDFEAPHIRVVIAHDEADDGPVKDAFDALVAAHLDPVICQAVTVPVQDSPGHLRSMMRKLILGGFDLESVVVLGSCDQSDVLVSFGVRRRVEADWERTALALAQQLVAD